ncbi:hypothetical protein ACFLYE_04040 [Chloroflexota bacterium]
MAKAEYQELFLFAAKAGSLEGYLFQRGEVEPLTGWIDNMVEMYRGLSPAVKREANPACAPVLRRILEYGEKTLEPGLRKKVEQILQEATTD